MKYLTWKLAALKGVGIALSPLLLLGALVALQPLLRDSIRSWTHRMFVPVGEPDVPQKVAVKTPPAGSSVLTPISLVDEAFRGYERAGWVPPTPKARERKGAVQEEKPPEPVSIRSVLPEMSAVEGTTGTKTPLPESRQSIRGGSRSSSPAPEPSPGRSMNTVKSPEDIRARYLTMVEERAAAAGLSGAMKAEMIRSFEELSSMMPPADAWKLVSLRIRDQAVR